MRTKTFLGGSLPESNEKNEAEAVWLKSLPSKEPMKLTKAEEEAMEKPTDFKCHRCGRIFRRYGVKLIRENSKGHFYCHECLEEMKKERESKGKGSKKKKKK